MKGLPSPWHPVPLGVFFSKGLRTVLCSWGSRGSPGWLVRWPCSQAGLCSSWPSQGWVTAEVSGWDLGRESLATALPPPPPLLPLFSAAGLLPACPRWGLDREPAVGPKWPCQRGLLGRQMPQSGPPAATSVPSVGLTGQLQEAVTAVPSSSVPPTPPGKAGRAG